VSNLHAVTHDPFPCLVDNRTNVFNKRFIGDILKSKNILVICCHGTTNKSSDGLSVEVIVILCYTKLKQMVL
jgi:hypothetical protein